jgi:hypothetical protein
MKTVYIIRTMESNQGTAGILVCPDTSFECRTMELPWNDNKNNISCIPRGRYIVKPYSSRKYGNTFIVTNVDGRSYILFHSGNYAGSTADGYKTHSRGCILLGQKHGVLGGQLAVLNSRITVTNFIASMKKEEFNLMIL